MVDVLLQCQRYIRQYVGIHGVQMEDVLMPTSSGSRKKAGKKKTASKVSKKPTAKKKASKKVSKKVAGSSAKSSSGKALSHEQRHAMIREAAYYLAEQRGFDGESDMDDWLAAEAFIDSQLGD